MHFVTVKTKTEMATWRTAFNLLPLEVFVNLIDWFVKKFYFWKTFLPVNFREMNSKKVPNFLTVDEPLLDSLGFCWTCPVCVKMSSPKIWFLKSVKWDSIKLRAHCFQNFILCTVCLFSETFISCITMDQST
jgi:hypothetical protein